MQLPPYLCGQDFLQAILLSDRFWYKLFIEYKVISTQTYRFFILYCRQELLLSSLQGEKTTLSVSVSVSYQPATRFTNLITNCLWITWTIIHSSIFHTFIKKVWLLHQAWWTVQGCQQPKMNWSQRKNNISKTGNYVSNISLALKGK